tara:strand:+ start:852 stop:1031 length:180 start_codon:yes stop_codon:yes gene_type:complete
MADITTIVSGSLPEIPKQSISPEETLNSLSTSHGEVYVIRILIDKVNELVKEVNILKNQ